MPTPIKNSHLVAGIPLGMRIAFMGLFDIFKKREPSPNDSLLFGVQNDNATICRAALQAGAEPNIQLNIPGAPGVIPIYWASGKGHARAVKALIDGGGMVNYRNTYDPNHQSNLMFAILYDQIDVVEVLLNAGANPDNGWDGETPLTFLKRRSTIISRSPIQRAGDEKMIRLLEAKGAK